MAQLLLSLLGTFQARLEGHTISEFKSDKARALLAYLAVEGEQPHPRDHLAGLLWPDWPDVNARANLRHALNNLRTVLHDQEAAPPFLLSDRQTVQLNPESDYRLDVAEFSQALVGLADVGSGQTGEQRVQSWQRAVQLYAGPFMNGFFLPDCSAFEEWLLLTRERLQLQMLAVLRVLALHFEQQGDYKEARSYVRRQLALDPLQEEAHSHLMRLLALSGERSAALIQFETCRRLLAEALGVEPAAETVALHKQIQTGELGRGKGAEEQVSRKEKLSPAPNPEPVEGLLPRSHAQDWGEAPEIKVFYGRQAELATLEQWLVVDRCRLVAVLGMGGLGKTALAAKLAQTGAGQFECVIWRSLLNAPPFNEILLACLQFLSAQQITTLPDSLDGQLALLLHQLRQQRCLIVLDNLETILQSGERAGSYRSGYEAYGQLIQRVGESKHQSGLLLTSRERPKGFRRLEGETGVVRSLQLAGLETEAGEALLEGQRLSGPAKSRSALVERYSGNPLALRLVAETIHELFEGDIAAFLTEETPIFDDIREVLEQQFARLPALEQEILTWLAIEREAVGPEQLQANLIQPPRQRELLERLLALRRRSLLEKNESGFTLQNVVMEYVTDRLVEAVCQELIEEKVTEQLNRYALLKAQAKEYVRASQSRLILQPIVERLRVRHGSEGLESQLRGLVVKLRQSAEVPKTAEVSETSAVSTGLPGYAAGNLLNLLLYLKPEVWDLDFSGLAVWQAYLQGMRLRKVNFSRTDLTGSVFTNTFGTVLSVAFSPDSRLLAAGTTDGRVWVWRTADGQLLLAREAHANAVSSICFSPDGQILASGSWDQRIRLWSLHSGQCLKTLEGHTAWVNTICFSLQGQSLASSSEDQTIRLWDVGTGQCFKILEGHTNWVEDVSFSPDGQSLVSGSGDQTIRLWDVNTGQCLKILKGHINRVRSVSFSPDGQSLASGSEDHTIHLWDVGAGQCLKILEGHTQAVLSACFSPDGQILASGSQDETIRLWDLHSGQCLKILQGHTHWVSSICFSPDGQSLASGAWDQTIRLWDLHSGQCLKILHGHTAWVNCICFSPDGQSLASASTDRTIFLWEVHTGQELKTLQGHTNNVDSISFSPDGQSLVSGSSDQTIRLWDVGSGHCLKTLKGHSALVCSVSFSPNGQILASGSHDQTIHLWDVGTGQCLRILHEHTDRVWTVSFSPDGRSLVSGSADETLRLWDVGTGQCLQTLKGHSDMVGSVSFSPDGQILASGSSDQTIRLWDVNTGQCLRTLEGHSSLVWGICFSPDGQILASSSHDKTIRLWDVGTGRCLDILEGHTQMVLSVCFSPGGQILASGSADETLRLWDVKSGTCLKILRAGGPYERLNITGITGLTEAQKAALKALGAVEDIT